MSLRVKPETAPDQNNWSRTKITCDFCPVDHNPCRTILEILVRPDWNRLDQNSGDRPPDYCTVLLMVPSWKDFPTGGHWKRSRAETSAVPSHMFSSRLEAVWGHHGLRALATHGPSEFLYFYALVTQLPFSELRSTVICVEITIRSVFACLVDLEATKACSTLKWTRNIYMHTACYVYMYSASHAYHSALAQVVLPYFC